MTRDDLLVMLVILAAAVLLGLAVENLGRMPGEDLDRAGLTLHCYGYHEGECRTDGDHYECTWSKRDELTCASPMEKPLAP